MEVKILEVRDYATFIPVMAIQMKDTNEEQRYLMARCGLQYEKPLVCVVKLNDNKCECDPYKWTDARTMRIAHEYIRDYFDFLKDGDVVDVQFILGETKQPKLSERYTDP